MKVMAENAETLQLDKTAAESASSVEESLGLDFGPSSSVREDNDDEWIDIDEDVDGDKSATPKSRAPVSVRKLTAKNSDSSEYA